MLPFTLDFDVIAHEVGHAFIYSVLGVPRENAEFPEYEGFQEAFSDCVSLITAMHFPSVIDQVLDETRGNLYLSNRIARFSEFPGQRQIRTANNTHTMDEFVDGYKNEHDLSEPLTGAIFDILADIFHESLLERGLISPEVEELAEMVEFGGAESAELQDAFDRAYADDSDGFREALVDARDIIGTYLAETLWDLDPDFLDYGDVAETLLAVDERETGGRYAEIIDSNFERRGIGILHAGPRLRAEAARPPAVAAYGAAKGSLEAPEDELSGALRAREAFIGDSRNTRRCLYGETTHRGQRKPAQRVGSVSVRQGGERSADHR